MKKSKYGAVTFVPSLSTLYSPHGRVVQLSSLFNFTETTFGSPYFNTSFKLKVNGRKPPKCLPNFFPLTYTVASCAAAKNLMSTSLSFHAGSAKKAVEYQKSPVYSLEYLSVKKSAKLAGTGISIAVLGSPFA